MRYLLSATIEIHIFTFVWELPCSLRSCVCQTNCIGKDVARSYFKIFYCIWPQPIKLCICYQQLISYFTNYLWLLDAEYNFLEIKIGQKCAFQDTCSPVQCIIAKSILLPIRPDEYLKHEFKLKIMPGKFNWPLTIYALYLRLILLGKSWRIIILPYLNCPYILLPMHMCISHATRHTDKHIPPCMLVATRNFKGPYVHLFIHHGINNLYLCRWGHRKKNNQWWNMQNAARMASWRDVWCHPHTLKCTQIWLERGEIFHCQGAEKSAIHFYLMCFRTMTI